MNIEDEIYSLKSNRNELSSKVSDLRYEVKQLNKRIDSLENLLKEVRDAVDVLMSQFETYVDSRDDPKVLLSDVLEDIDYRLYSLERDVEDHEVALNNLF